MLSYVLLFEMAAVAGDASPVDADVVAEAAGAIRGAGAIGRGRLGLPLGLSLRWRTRRFVDEEDACDIRDDTNDGDGKGDANKAGGGANDEPVNCADEDDDADADDDDADDDKDNCAEEGAEDRTDDNDAVNEDGR